MTEPTAQAPVTAQEPTEPQQSSDAPPWGADFDPARAWHTIQQLREREKELAKQPRMSAEQQQQLSEYNRLVEASKSETQRLTEAAEVARRDAESARAEAVRYRVAAEHGISVDHFDLLGSGTEEEIAARAAKLSALVAAQAQIHPASAAPPQTRPIEQLRPGATPSETQSEDDVVFERLFGAK